MPANCPWGELTPGSVAFCEARLCGWVAEPANSWSSLAYVLVGAVLLLRFRRDLRVAWVAIAEIAIGLGSIAFHATGSLFGELLDQTGMYLLSCIILVYAASASLAWSAARTTATCFAAVAGSALVTALAPPLGIPLFAVQLASGLGWEAWLSRRASDRSPWRYLWQGIGLFLAAFAIWTLDITRVLCDPDNHVLGGHAVWHLLNAASIARLHRFYRARWSVTR